METFDRKKHWENIYNTKELQTCSWFQEVPVTSLTFIETSGIPTDASIIDVGGGDSYLVDALLERGYSNISVLDISETALNKAKLRLGKKAALVKWYVGDVANFEPTESYDFWHDRATFHFLTKPEETAKYVETVNQAVKANGHLLVGTFSDKGPTKCSGIEIQQYSKQQLTALFEKNFKLREASTVDHLTPSGSVQNFTFCFFDKR